MTTIEASLRATTGAPTARGNGGVAARRAVMRWSLRLFRREWRQQLVVLLLLIFSTAAALFAAVAVYHMPSSSDARFGTARHRITINSDDPAALEAKVADLSTQYAPVEVIDHASVPVPGSLDVLDVRAEDPQGTFGRPMLSLRSGRYPSTAAEVDITDGAAALLHLHLGDQATFGRATGTVVGIVENPAALDDEFILALPGSIAEPSSVTLLVNGHDDTLGDRANSARIMRFDGDSDKVTALAETRGKAEGGAAALLVLALDTVALLLVSLVAAAAFVVVAHRRLRQLGMLAAIGATDRQLRLVMLAHGFVVGVAAAIAGSVVALASWFTFGSRLESVAGHRIDLGDVPWLVVAIGMVLALVTTTATAWWPARAIARVPVVRALSGRPPAPRRSHRSLAVAIVALAIGIVSLVVGIHKDGTANAAEVIVGPIAIVVGMLFLAPLAIRLFATTAGRFPIAARLALRDLARHQARAGAALAAISLGLGVACTAVIVSAAATPSATSGNLSSHQLLFRIGRGESVTPQTAAQVAALQAAIDGFATQLDGALVLPLDAATNTPDPGGGNQLPSPGSPDGQPGLPAVLVGERVPHGVAVRGNNIPYVVTPALLAHLGIDPSTIDPAAEVITPQSGDLMLVDPVTTFDKRRDPDTFPSAKIQTIPDPGFGDEPKTLITETAMQSHGWVRTPAGWFLQSDHALTAQQRSDARDLAARTGMVVITRDDHHGLAVTRNAATLVGLILALGILAMTIGLIRGEATRDLQTLTATGATSHARRVITATTAASLALLGAVLGIGAAYTALVAGYSDHLHPLTQVPWSNLVVILVSLPVIAGVGGWLLAGREPPGFARQTLD